MASWGGLPDIVTTEDDKVMEMESMVEGSPVMPYILPKLFESFDIDNTDESMDVDGKLIESTILAASEGVVAKI